MTPDEAADAYRFMLLMRRSEEIVGQLYALGHIATEPKLSIGREALVAGLVKARKSDDGLVVGRRCHGFLLALGVDLDVLLAALIANSQCAAHPWSPLHKDGGLWPCQFYYQGGRPDAIVTTAMSLALFKRLHRQTSVVFVVLEDNAFSHPRFYDRLAACVRWQLPIVFVMDRATPDVVHTLKRQDHSTSDQNTVKPLFHTVNGIDDQCVQRACIEARDRARQGLGPQGLIVSTQAFRGHASKPAPKTVKSASHTLPAHDPVLLARARVAPNGRGDMCLADEIDGDIRALVRSAGQRARAR